MQHLIRGQRFALIELILVVLCGAVWLVKAEWGIWFILIALVPLALRIFGGEFQFNSIDGLVIVFVATAWVGYWVAYDQAAAWNKAWLIVTAVLLYFSLKAQPQKNLVKVSGLFFCIGVGISIYYFLTHDFIAIPRKIDVVNQMGRWIMSVRPKTGWTPIHPNYVAGVIAVMVPFVFYPFWEFRKRNSKVPVWFLLAVVPSLVVSGLALMMATSRGVLFAIAGGAGAWLLWRSVNLRRIKRRFKSEAVFPILLMVYLCVTIAFLYIGPARSGSLFSRGYNYGNGSRAELFSRSLYLLSAFPVTGGGLNSFPGLYSHYLLGIPFFNVPNSHNLFLDVGIEQGVLGGSSFLILYLSSILMVAGAIARKDTDQIFNWVVLFSLIVVVIHGMVDDYLYNGAGTILSLFLVGLSMNGREYGTYETRIGLRTISIVAILLVVIAMVNLNKIRAIWYADLGAVQLAKVELDGFPNVGWVGEDIIPRLSDADTSLHSSLQFDPTNRTANQRLGLISMLRGDFNSAIRYLETAYAQAPKHRGIIKSLAYCYVWLGEFEKAQELLSQIPEAADELDVYVWWWKTQGRSDLSKNASSALDALKTASSQP